MHPAVPGALWAARGRCTCVGAALLANFLSELRVPAPLLCVRLRIRQSFPFSEARFLGLGGSALQRRGPSPGGGGATGLLWPRRTTRSPRDAAWKVEGEGLASAGAFFPTQQCSRGWRVSWRGLLSDWQFPRPAFGCWVMALTVLNFPAHRNFPIHRPGSPSAKSQPYNVLHRQAHVSLSPQGSSPS
jgi:hypothetical protein